MDKMKAGKMILTLTASILTLGVSLQAQDAAAGKTVYSRKCQACHGADGSGNPGIAKALSVELRPLGSADVQKRTDDEFKKIITTGNGKMKPVAGVSDKEVNDVVAYIRTLKAK